MYCFGRGEVAGNDLNSFGVHSPPGNVKLRKTSDARSQGGRIERSAIVDRETGPIKEQLRKPFTCFRCHQSFSLWEALEQHRQSENCSSTALTPTASQASPSRVQPRPAPTVKPNPTLRENSAEKRPLNPPAIFSCVKCNRSFVSRRWLNKHYYSKDCQNKIRCVECNRSFGSQLLLNQHFDSQHRQNEIRCVECNRSIIIVRPAHPKTLPTPKKDASARGAKAVGGL